MDTPLNVTFHDLSMYMDYGTHGSPFTKTRILI